MRRVSCIYSHQKTCRVSFFMQLCNRLVSIPGGKPSYIMTGREETGRWHSTDKGGRVEAIREGQGSKFCLVSTHRDRAIHHRFGQLVLDPGAVAVTDPSSRDQRSMMLIDVTKRFGSSVPCGRVDRDRCGPRTPLINRRRRLLFLSNDINDGAEGVERGTARRYSIAEANRTSQHKRST